MNPETFPVFPTLVLFIGFVFFLRSLWQLLAAVDSNRWPHVEGVIVDSDIEEGWFRDGDGRGSHPKESVLEPGLSAGVIGGLALGSIITIAGIVLFRSAWQSG